MLYHVGDNRHTQNIQINKVTGEMKNVFSVTEKMKRTFWPTHEFQSVKILNVSILLSR